MLRRSETRHHAAELDLSTAIEPLFDPELRLLETEGRTAVKAAFQAAFEGLGARDKMVLAYQLVDGLPVREIGRILGVDGSSVSRRLARIRTELLDETLQEEKRTDALLSKIAASINAAGEPGGAEPDAEPRPRSPGVEEEPRRAHGEVLLARGSSGLVPGELERHRSLLRRGDL